MKFLLNLSITCYIVYRIIDTINHIIDAISRIIDAIFNMTGDALEEGAKYELR